MAVDSSTPPNTIGNVSDNAPPYFPPWVSKVLVMIAPPRLICEADAYIERINI